MGKYGLDRFAPQLKRHFWYSFLEVKESPAQTDLKWFVWHCRNLLWPVMSVMIIGKITLLPKWTTIINTTQCSTHTHTHTHARTHSRTHSRMHARTHTHTHTLVTNLIVDSSILLSTDQDQPLARPTCSLLAVLGLYRSNPGNRLPRFESCQTQIYKIDPGFAFPRTNHKILVPWVTLYVVLFLTMSLKKRPPFLSTIA